jgi:hypothetical protein
MMMTMTIPALMASISALIRGHILSSLAKFPTKMMSFNRPSQNGESA